MAGNVVRWPVLGEHPTLTYEVPPPATRGGRVSQRCYPQRRQSGFSPTDWQKQQKRTC